MHLNESVTFIVTHFLTTVLYFIVTNFFANDEKEACVIKKSASESTEALLVNLIFSFF